MIIPVGFAQIAWGMSLTGDQEPMVCTMGAEITLGGPFLQAEADAIHAAWGDNILPVTASDYSLVVTKIRYNLGAGIQVIEATGPVASAGGFSGAPPNVSWLARKRSSLSGVKHRGRMYVPGVVESGVTNTGHVIPGTLAVYQAALDGLLADLLASVRVNKLVILHSDVTAPTEIISLTADTLVATQRGRLRR